jgi:hypothetical protein
MKYSRPFFSRLGLGAVTGLIITVAYRGIQHGTESRAVVRDDCWAWQWLPFEPAWIWPYLSMFLLVGLPWFLLPGLRQVKRFAWCLLAVAATGWTVFLVYPTACARPDATGQPFYYAALLALDRSNNCLPCLHSAMAVLAAWVLGYGSEIFGHFSGRVLLAVWTGLISVSIVALRQHTDADMMVGMILGGMAATGWTYGERASRVCSAA